MERQKQLRPFSARDKWGYAFGDLGCGLSFSLVSTYMLLFYTQYIGLETKDWEWIIVVSKAWDAINDILIGNMVDRRRISKKSKFTPWILIGAVGLVFLTVMIFFAPVQSFSYNGKVIWCLAAYCLWSVAYTMVNVPYGSLHSIITDDSKQRTTLSTFRSIGAGIAMIFVMMLPAIVYKKAEDGSNIIIGDKIFIVSIVFSIGSLIFLFLMTRMITERVPYGEVPENINYMTALRSFFSNRPMIGATLATVASVIFYNSAMSMNNLVFQFYFNDAKKTTVATIASYVPLLLFMPFANKLTAKFGKKNLVSLFGAFSAVAAIIMLLLPIGRDKAGMIMYTVGLMFVNIGNCIFQIIVWAIIVDCIELNLRKKHLHEEGSLYAIYSFFRKFAQGIGSALVARSLSMIGFVEGKNAVQPESFCTGILKLYVGFMLIGTVIMALCMKFVYSIDKEKELELGKPEAAAADD